MATVTFTKEYKALVDDLKTQQNLKAEETKDHHILTGDTITITRELLCKHFPALSQVPTDIADSIALTDIFTYTGRITKLTKDEVVISSGKSGGKTVNLHQVTADLLDEISRTHKKSKRDIAHEALMLYIEKN